MQSIENDRMAKPSTWILNQSFEHDKDASKTGELPPGVYQRFFKLVYLTSKENWDDGSSPISIENWKAAFSLAKKLGSIRGLRFNVNADTDGHIHLSWKKSPNSLLLLEMQGNECLLSEYKNGELIFDDGVTLKQLPNHLRGFADERIYR